MTSRDKWFRAGEVAVEDALLCALSFSTSNIRAAATWDAIGIEYLAAVSYGTFAETLST